MSFGALDVRAVCLLTCTVDTRNKSDDTVYSSVFQFQGEEFRLYYYYGDQHTLGLERKSYVPAAPFDVSVQLECDGGTGRVGTALPQVTRFTIQFEVCTMHRIWEKKEEEILRSVPEIHQRATLKFIVVLKPRGTDLLNLAGCDPKVLEIKSNGPSTRSISVQTTLLPNTMPCLESLSEDLGQLMVEGSDHDVEFQCGGQSTKAHRSIVCSRSPVIASMLSSDMVEGRTGVVTIPDMQPEVFKHFLRYIYSGQMPGLSVDLAISLFESGDQYAVLGLAKRCSEYLVEHLSEENACRVLVVADAHSSKDFKESVIGFMLDKEIPLSGGDWQDFCDAHPKLGIEVLNRFCLKLKRS